MSQNRITGSPVTITSDSLVIDAPLKNRGLYFVSESETGPTPRSLAVGTLAGSSLTSGADNTFFGFNTGEYTTIGIHNTFTGSQSGNANVNGNSNTFGGSFSGHLATGSWNTAHGHLAAYRVTGNDNCVYGQNAATLLTSGSNNFLGGKSIAGALASGSRNVILGHTGGVSQACQTLVSGNDNIIICSDTLSAASNGLISIGKPGVQTACLVAGITGVSQTGPNVAVTVNGSGQLGIGAVSLRSKKDDIEAIDEVENHEKLMQVKPRNYTFKDWDEKVQQHGVIIDEIKPIYPELVGQCNGEDFYVNYEQFIALLIADLQYAWKSMHQLESRLVALENKNM